MADAIFSNYWTIALLLRQGVDMISHHDGRRHVDFRQGQRLGRYDHVVPWHKPVRPFWMSRKLYRALPETLTVREVKVEVTQKGFRRRHLLLITTLLDPKVYPQEDLATAFRCRWHAELDLRSIKHVMQTMPAGRQVDVLRCKSPAMVRKEVWMHLPAYHAYPAGRQPDPQADGPSGGEGGDLPQGHQLQRDAPDPGRLRGCRVVVSRSKK